MEITLMVAFFGVLGFWSSSLVGPQQLLGYFSSLSG
jgi:hypothetical protein